LVTNSPVSREMLKLDCTLTPNLRQAEALQAINGTVELAVFKPEMLIPALLMQPATVFPRDFPQSDET
jgi:hypothetical protein